MIYGRGSTISSEKACEWGFVWRWSHAFYRSPDFEQRKIQTSYRQKDGKSMTNSMTRPHSHDFADSIVSYIMIYNKKSIKVISFALFH